MPQAKSNQGTDTVQLPAQPLLQLLTDQDRQHLENVRSRIAAIEDALARAEACLIDVTQHRERHQLHDQLSKTMLDTQFHNPLPSYQE